MAVLLSPIDRFLVQGDRLLRTIFAVPVGRRHSPARNAAEGRMTEVERREAAALMRVNHAGEVCAQALYQAQALCARTPQLRAAYLRAADEETDHLAWTSARLQALGGGPSRLGVFWYAGSFAIGGLAGCFGDRWSLGFLAETERQVDAHLALHEARWPQADQASLAVLAQMRRDETAHAERALSLGAQELPRSIRSAMHLTAGILKTVAYRV